jgi:hypothetical protein
VHPPPQKKDINGFYPAMTWVKFEKHVKTIVGIRRYCTDLEQIRYHIQHQNDRTLICDVGKFPNEGKRFTFTFYRPPGTSAVAALLLKSIDLQFSSNIPTLEMIAYVSKQYGGEPFKKTNLFKRFIELKEFVLLSR